MFRSPFFAVSCLVSLLLLFTTACNAKKMADDAFLAPLLGKSYKEVRAVAPGEVFGPDNPGSLTKQRDVGGVRILDSYLFENKVCAMIVTSAGIPAGTKPDALRAAFIKDAVAMEEAFGKGQADALRSTLAQVFATPESVPEWGTSWETDEIFVSTGYFEKKETRAMGYMLEIRSKKHFPIP
ncbi:MAG: hypothetical protein DELT_00835 [Desulfovibrio sp.]